MSGAVVNRLVQTSGNARPNNPIHPERAVYKLASQAAVISEGQASGGHAYCAEA